MMGSIIFVGCLSMSVFGEIMVKKCLIAKLLVFSSLFLIQAQGAVWEEVSSFEKETGFDYAFGLKVDESQTNYFASVKVEKVGDDQVQTLFVFKQQGSTKNEVIGSFPSYVGFLNSVNVLMDSNRLVTYAGERKTNGETEAFVAVALKSDDKSWVKFIVPQTTNNQRTTSALIAENKVYLQVLLADEANGLSWVYLYELDVVSGSFKLLDTSEKTTNKLDSGSVFRDGTGVIYHSYTITEETTQLKKTHLRAGVPSSDFSEVLNVESNFFFGIKGVADFKGKKVGIFNFIQEGSSYFIAASELNSLDLNTISKFSMNTEAAARNVIWGLQFDEINQRFVFVGWSSQSTGLSWFTSEYSLKDKQFKMLEFLPPRSLGASIFVDENGVAYTLGYQKKNDKDVIVIRKEIQ
jgi:hypothetical protein